MKNIITRFIVIVLTFASLSLKGQDFKNYKMSINEILVIDSTDYILIPIQWRTNAKINDVKISGSNWYRNILVYNPKNDQTDLIFKDSLQIVKPFYNRSYYSDKPKPIKLINEKYLLISARNDDFDINNKLNYNDPLYLFMYNITSTELTQLTPKNYSVKQYKYIESQNIIIVSLREDSNKDLNFDVEDKEILYKIDLENLSKSKELFEIKIKTK